MKLFCILSYSLYSDFGIKAHKVIWCPICKQGEVQEKYFLISCTRCEFKLNNGDEVSLFFTSCLNSNTSVHTEISHPSLGSYCDTLI